MAPRGSTWATTLASLCELPSSQGCPGTQLELLGTAKAPWTAFSFLVVGASPRGSWPRRKANTLRMGGRVGPSTAPVSSFASHEPPVTSQVPLNAHSSGSPVTVAGQRPDSKRQPAHAVTHARACAQQGGFPRDLLRPAPGAGCGGRTRSL